MIFRSGGSRQWFLVLSRTTRKSLLNKAHGTPSFFVIVMLKPCCGFTVNIYVCLQPYLTQFWRKLKYGSYNHTVCILPKYCASFFSLNVTVIRAGLRYTINTTIHSNDYVFKRFLKHQHKDHFKLLLLYKRLLKFDVYNLWEKNLCSCVPTFAYKNLNKNQIKQNKRMWRVCSLLIQNTKCVTSRASNLGNH
jgi:hypothetical protein